MDGPGREWNVDRRGGTVRVDLKRVAYISLRDAEAIQAAAEELLQDEAVSIVQVEGPMPHGDRPIGLGRTLKVLQRLAETYGKRLVVSPI